MPGTSAPLEHYAVIGDTETVALVGRDGSMDWLCAPRFDSGACFAALLGGPEHGRWLVAPAGEVRETRRRYRDGTLVLETDFVTDGGVVRVTDCMPPRDEHVDVMRRVEGVAGRVEMRMHLVIRFDYGWILPWVRRLDGLLSALAGPDALYLQSDVEPVGADHATTAEFAVAAGESVGFALTWRAAEAGPPTRRHDVDAKIAETDAWWRAWSSRGRGDGELAPAVERSLITLKALTYAPTGGVVAAATTSLPEHLGGVRNWDYRYCWLRDATFTLLALMGAGYEEEAEAWRDWLLRAAAGDPARLQIMYGPAGERRLSEMEVDWLPGYEGSRPVRIGNAAAAQLQLDVYGEVMDSLHVAREIGIQRDEYAWDLQRALLDFLEGGWRQPDEGIWEIRGPRRDFVHSKVLVWVAFDRAVAAVERAGLEGPVDRWRSLAAEVRAEVLDRGYDVGRGTFTQYYGSREVDASLLQLPLVGFISADDPRMRGTVAAIEHDLGDDGLVWRYPTSEDVGVDGLAGREGAFLACGFWMVDNLVLQGRRTEALARFRRLLRIANDVGLLAEQYDPTTGRMVGNFPQALSHVALVNSARNLEAAPGEAAFARAPAGVSTDTIDR